MKNIERQLIITFLQVVRKIDINENFIYSNLFEFSDDFSYVKHLQKDKKYNLNGYEVSQLQEIFRLSKSDFPLTLNKLNKVINEIDRGLLNV